MGLENMSLLAYTGSSWTLSSRLSSKTGPHVGLKPRSLVYTGSRQTGFGWLTLSTPCPGALAHPGFPLMPAHSAPGSRAPGRPVSMRGWLPGSLSLTALLGAKPTYPSLDIQLVLELPVGQWLSGPGLFPLDEAVGLVAVDGDVVGWVVLLCNETPGDTCDAECLRWSTEGRPLSAIPTETGAPDFTKEGAGSEIGIIHL